MQFTERRRDSKKHWTLLALARFYDKYGTSARTRDLFASMERIHEDPQHLSATLWKLKDEGLIEAHNVMAPTRDGSKTKVFAYYPVKPGIEQLRELGQPSELSDGSPIPDGVKTEIPSARVENGDDPDPPSMNTPTPDYKHTAERTPDHETGSTGNYDTSGVSEPAHPDTTDDDDPDYDVSDEDIDWESTDCPYCGDSSFDTKHSLRGHVAQCPEYDPDEDDGLEPVYEQHASGPDLAVDDIEEVPMFEDGAGIDEDDFHTPGYVADSLSEPARLGNRIENMAERAEKAGLYDIATAYSELARRTANDELDIEVVRLLLGLPTTDDSEEVAHAKH